MNKYIENKSKRKHTKLENNILQNDTSSSISKSTKATRENFLIE